jgi:hypothetical protein
VNDIPKSGPLTDNQLKELFHQIWTANALGEYPKDKWNRLQWELNRRKVTIGTEL